MVLALRICTASELADIVFYFKGLLTQQKREDNDKQYSNLGHAKQVVSPHNTLFNSLMCLVVVIWGEFFVLTIHRLYKNVVALTAHKFLNSLSSINHKIFTQEQTVSDLLPRHMLKMNKLYAKYQTLSQKIKQMRDLIKYSILICFAIIYYACEKEQNIDQPIVAGKSQWEVYQKALEDVNSRVKNNYFGYDFIPTSDNFYILGNGRDQNKIDISKKDMNGQVIWRYENSVPEGLTYSVDGIYETEDKGFIIIGTKGSRLYTSDVHITKLNANGQMVWEKIHDFDDREIIYDVIDTEDGGSLILLLAVDKSSENYSDRMYMAKTDNEGEILWKKDFDDPNMMDLSNILESETGYLCLGAIEQRCMAMFEFDKQGTLMNIVEFPDTILVDDLEHAHDGGYMLLTSHVDTTKKMRKFGLMKINQDGTFDWHKKYFETEDVYFNPYSIDLYGDTDYVVVCKKSTVKNQELIAIVLDNEGSVIEPL